MENLIGIQFLSRPQVDSLHDEMLKQFGGGKTGVRDENMLESAIGAPKAMMFGQFLHGSIHEMAAAYLISLAKNHGYHDANKRTAGHAVATFYRMNGYRLVVPIAEWVEFIVSVASEKPVKDAVAAYLQQHIETCPVPKG